MLTRIVKLFGGKTTFPPHFALSCRIDLYFPKHKLAIGFYKKGHKGRDKHKEIESNRKVS